MSVSFGQIFVGVVIGLVWGYVRKLDRFFTELYNLIDNIPVIIYMTLIALMLGKTTLIMGVAMIGFGWLATARNVRNLVFMYRDREYNPCVPVLGYQLVAHPLPEHSALHGERNHSPPGTGHPWDHCL